MDNLTIGDHNRNAYVAVRLGDNDLDTEGFEHKDEALDFINETEDKCILVCIEYDGGGVYKVKVEPHT